MSTRFFLPFYRLVVSAAIGLFVPVAGATAASEGPTCAALSAFACGDADRDGSVTSTDALLALQAGISTLYCDPCLCDTSGSNGVTATDALMVLSHAVGGQVLFGCEGCAESVCGDATLTPFRGASLGTTLMVADWCLLLDADPNHLERDITATITKALDTWVAPVADIEVEIVSHGCDCGFLRADLRENGASTTTVGSVTTSTLGFCNCMAGVRVKSPATLALVEAYIDLYDGDCGEFVGPGTVLIDGGVEEECDDGNLTDGDGCSAECRPEP